MGKLIKNLYEHLKTRKKYNTLKLNYDVLREEYDRKTTELNVERQIWRKRQNVWEDALLKQEQQIIELKKRRKNEKKVKTKKES